MAWLVTTRNTAKATAGPAVTSKVINLKITLLGLAPLVWRRFSVPSEITLIELHNVIQIVMGWLDNHQYQFIDKRGARYIPGFRPEDDPQVIDGTGVSLREIAGGPGSVLVYQYDFGDAWEHFLKILSIEDQVPGVSYPFCLDGQHACPPEDCGGPWGYRKLSKILDDPTHEEYGERFGWVSSDSSPERFDIEEVNELLLHETCQREGTSRNSTTRYPSSSCRSTAYGYQAYGV